MSRTAKTVAHIVLQYGIDMLDQAYADLPADQRATPDIRRAMAALDALYDALMTSLTRAVRLDANDRSSLDVTLFEEALAKLGAAWSAVPDDHRHDVLTDRWKRRCARYRRMAIARKRMRAAK